MSKSDWFKCLDCGHVWDDLNRDHEICACFDKLGRRRSLALNTVTVPSVANANANTTEYVIHRVAGS